MGDDDHCRAFASSQLSSFSSLSSLICFLCPVAVDLYVRRFQSEEK